MKKSERLLQLLILLRGKRSAITAEELADRLQVSQRTVYRDIQSLLMSGVDIAGEAGVGYCLQPGTGIPPLMFTEEELEAVVLGIRWVKSAGDDELVAAAETAKDKIRAVLPERTLQRHEHKATKYLVPDSHRNDRVRFSTVIREAIETFTVLEVDYADEKGRQTQRRINPLGMVFWAPNWTVVAWCQLRDGYRLFRLDRLQGAVALESRFELNEECNFAHYIQQYDPNASTNFW